MESKFVLSHLSQSFEENGIHVQVNIYRLEDESVWWLRVIDEEGMFTIWDEPFDSDQEAWDYFRGEVADNGLADLLTDDICTMH